MPTSYLTPESLHPGAVFHGGHGGGLGFALRLPVWPPGGAKVGKQGNFRGALRANPEGDIGMPYMVQTGTKCSLRGVNMVS